MDPGKSGSMQSSSGGGEELSSRGESISSILNSTNPSPHFGSISTTHHQQPQNPTFFDPHNQYNDGNNNDHLVWSRNLRSHEPNYANLGNLTTPSLLLPSIASSQAPFPNPNPSPPNPKKRTRASRRAPTTVLTTDTANFRQMVQEFTGIPAVPLSASPYSRRMDLFSSIRTANGTEDPLWFSGRSHLDTFGPSPSLDTNMMNAASAINLGASSSNISSTDHFLNQQKHDDFSQQFASNASTLNYGGLSGHEPRFTDDGNLNIWKVEEIVRNSQENLATTMTFDGRNIINKNNNNNHST